MAAFHGMHAAKHSRTEDNTESEHQAFVKKQRTVNALACLVAVTYPVSFIPVIKNVRRRAQEKLIG